MNEPVPKTKWKLNRFARANEDRLPGFGKLLESWWQVHRDFCENAQPYFSWEWGHNERSHIGLLSNAAVLIGGLSIEESWLEKSSGEQTKCSGRSDLWLRLAPPGWEMDYLIEAKHSYLEVKFGLADCSRTIVQQMEAARKECARCLAHRKDNKIAALAFLSLKFQGQDLSLLEQNTADLIRHIQDDKGNKFDVGAAIWMGAADFVCSQQERENAYSGWKNENFGLLVLASRHDG